MLDFAYIKVEVDIFLVLLSITLGGYMIAPGVRLLAKEDPSCTIVVGFFMGKLSHIDERGSFHCSNSSIAIFSLPSSVLGFAQRPKIVTVGIILMLLRSSFWSNVSSD